MYVTIYNDKGGNCKSTFVREIALFFERAGKQPLVVDLDYKNSITKSFNIKTKKNIYNLIDEMTSTDSVLARTEFIDVIPGSYRVLDATINKSLKGSLDEIKEYYDYILIDTSGQNKISDMALYESDVIIVPVIPQRYDAQNLDYTLSYINEKKTPTQRIFVLIMRVDSSETSRVEVAEIEEIVKNNKATLLKTQIRDDETVKEIQLKNRELRSYNFVSDAAEDYKNLTEELIRRLDTYKEDIVKLKLLIAEQDVKKAEDEKEKLEKELELKNKEETTVTEKVEEKKEDDK